MRGARTDSNHSKIMEELRQFGASVTSIAALKNGEGDLLVGFGHRNYLFEVKDPDLIPSKRRQTAKGNTFASTWKGQRHIIFNTEQVIHVIKCDQQGV